MHLYVAFHIEFLFNNNSLSTFLKHLLLFSFLFLTVKIEKTSQLLLLFSLSLSLFKTIEIIKSIMCIVLSEKKKFV